MPRFYAKRGIFRSIFVSVLKQSFMSIIAVRDLSNMFLGTPNFHMRMYKQVHMDSNLCSVEYCEYGRHTEKSYATISFDCWKGSRSKNKYCEKLGTSSGS